MAASRAITNFSKGGFHKLLKPIFPLRKEVGEDSEEFINNLSRKICFDIGIPSFHTMGAFVLRHGSMVDTNSSGVVVFQIAKDINHLLWLKLGERIYDAEIELGKIVRSTSEGDEILEQKDYSHVTEEMLREALPKFVGRITQHHTSLSAPEPVNFGKLAICHEIQLQMFQPPVVRLRIRCGAGASPRTFAYELASEVGTVGHPKRLHRAAHGPFTYEDALPSYAVSWENCRKVGEKYAERMREFSWATRNSLSEEDLKLHVSEKRHYKIFAGKLKKADREKKAAAADTAVVKERATV